MAQINKSSEYFNTKLYTGNGTAIGSGGNAITGVGFQPDFVWVKSRSDAENHNLCDVVRGGTKIIVSNSSYFQQTTPESIASFQSDGFTVGNYNQVNTTSYNYVSWNWLAGGTGVSNTDGSITSTVSANTTSGFSIVTYTGTASNATVGHGLGAKPAMIIAKNLSTIGEDWAVYHKSLGGYQYYLKLNGNTAISTNTNRWNAEPDTSVFNVGSVGETNGSGTSQLAYVFVEKKGYSKFGSYVGNGNADGTFIYTGMKPAYVLTKRTDALENWVIQDNKQSPFNPTYDFLLADSYGNPTAGGTPIDLLSNGFKVRTTSTYSNASGGTYIYMAFAENPLVGTNGVPCTAR